MPNMNFNQNFGTTQYPSQNYYNPYNLSNFTTLPQYNIVQVNGKNGAEAFQMAPNSKALLLDETAPLVWFVQTDGAGYKTCTPYSITPYKPEQPEDALKSLEQRITNLEERLNAQSNSGTNKQSGSKRNANNERAADTTS